MFYCNSFGLKMEEIMKAGLNFIYAGENERPVRPLNFRPKCFGGLGYVEANIKAKALLVKSMIKRKSKGELVEDMYGYEEQFNRWLDCVQTGDKIKTGVKDIYNEMLKAKYEKNGSIIPSRNEKNLRNIK